MSNNAIMDWANQGRVDTESWGRYLERTYARPREMTAADLGLERDCYSGKCESPIFCEACDGCMSYTFAYIGHATENYVRSRHTDAPYSFWLGAGAHG